MGDNLCSYYCPHLLVPALNENKEQCLLLFSLLLLCTSFFIATLNNGDVRMTVSCTRPFGNDFILSADTIPTLWICLGCRFRQEVWDWRDVVQAGHLQAEDSSAGAYGWHLGRALLAKFPFLEYCLCFYVEKMRTSDGRSQLYMLVEGLREKSQLLWLQAASCGGQVEFCGISHAGCHCRRHEN